MKDALATTYGRWRSPAAKVFGPVIDWRTWLKTAHLAAMFPLGLAFPGGHLKQFFECTYHRELISFSSLTWSATKLRIPSASFSVAMASAFKS